jgi:hypothetical protein
VVPRQLGKKTRAVRRRILASYDISSEGQLALDAALAYHDRYQQATAVLAKEGLTVQGRNGVTAHPCVMIADASYKNFLAGLRYLNLSVDEVMDAEA